MTELVKTFPPHRRDLPKARYVYMTSKTYHALWKDKCIRPAAGPLNLETLIYPESERFDGCEIIVDDGLEKDFWFFDRPSPELVPHMIIDARLAKTRTMPMTDFANDLTELFDTMPSDYAITIARGEDGPVRVSIRPVADFVRVKGKCASKGKLGKLPPQKFGRYIIDGPPTLAETVALANRAAQKAKAMYMEGKADA